MALLSDILLFEEVSITLFVDALLFLLLNVAFFSTLTILKGWKEGATTTYQYQLEKRSYLVVIIISFVLAIKVILLPFFTYTLNELSTIVPGAMCAAGVVGANEYGEVVLILKAFIIMLTLLWIKLNKEDIHAKNYPYFRYKMWFFIALFIVITIELILQLLFLINISTDSPVLCCSVIYKDNSNPIPFNLSAPQLVMLFYTLSIALMTANYFKSRLFTFIFSLFNIYISYYAIVYFFSTYVYELPTHKCPFCLLQSDYNYIGYLIFASLFIGSFYALSASIFKFADKNFHTALIWGFIFIFVTSLPFLLYIIKNGVLL
jgi:hypothetical protein